MARAAKGALKTPSKNEWGLTRQQETFAQQVASGKSQADAYREAYPGSEKWQVAVLYSRASELAANGKVAGRIRDLRLIIQNQAIEAAVADKTWIMRRLKIVAERCLRAAPVLDRKGNPVMVVSEDGTELVPSFDFNAMGANRSLELLGKEAGMFVDRKETGKPGDFSNADDRATRQAATEATLVRLGVARIIPLARKKA